jgi:hypothetical protein
MAELINLNSLFGDILPPSASDLRSQGMQEANAAQLPGGMAALLAPQRFNNIRKASGGLFGVDTSTSKERLKQALTQIDMSSPQGQKKAVELIRAVSPTDALQLQNVFDSQAQASATSAAQTVTAEANRVRAAASELQAQTSKSLIPVEIQKANTAEFLSTIRADEATLASITQEDLTGWRASQLENQIRELDIREEENRVRESIAQTNAGDLDSRAAAAVREATKEGRVLRDKAAASLSIANQFTSLENIPAGAPALVAEKWKALLGNENEITLLRANYNSIKNALVMDSLPPGVASDKDIELALSGFLPSTANPVQVSSFMKGMAKISDISAKKEFMRAIHLTENKGIDAKFQEEWETYLASEEFGAYLTQRGHALNSDKSTSTLAVSPVSNTSLSDSIAAERARRASNTPTARRL